MLLLDDVAPLRTDLDLAVDDLDRIGCCRVTGLLSSGALEALASQTAALALDDERRGDAYWYGRTNQRLWSLPARGEAYLRLAEHPVARHLIEHVIGPEPLLSNLTANISGPSGGPLALHVDQHWAPTPWTHALVANAVWMLDDFTAENGATTLVPASHRTSHPPDASEAVPATGPAGTCLVLDGRLWHGTGANTTDRSRTGLLGYYCRPFLRPQENFARSLPPELSEALSPEHRRLLGLEPYEYLNLVGGPPAHTRGDRHRSA